MKHNDQMKENKTQVRDVILRTVKTQKLLSIFCVSFYFHLYIHL